MHIPAQIMPVSFVAMGDNNEMRGVLKKAMSRAFFSGPVGRRERNDGTTNNHQNQYPRTLTETSLFAFKE
jgi:hypothetical protein